LNDKVYVFGGCQTAARGMFGGYKTVNDLFALDLGNSFLGNNWLKFKENMQWMKIQGDNFFLTPTITPL